MKNKTINEEIEEHKKEIEELKTKLITSEFNYNALVDISKQENQNFQLKLKELEEKLKKELENNCLTNMSGITQIDYDSFLEEISKTFKEVLNNHTSERTPNKTYGQGQTDVSSSDPCSSGADILNKGEGK